MKKIACNSAMLAALLFNVSVQADMLEYKNGQVLDGQYQGGSQNSVRFMVNDELKLVSVKEILALTFTRAGPVVAPPKEVTAAPKAAAVPPVALGDAVVAPGVRIMVRTSGDISTKSKRTGDTFSAVLEANLMSGDTKIAPAGAKVYGQVINSKKGGIGARKAILELTLTSIQIDGKMYPMKTSVLAGEGASGGLGKKIIKGAAIGALADGHDGAEDGAKIGVGIGILAGGRHAGISPNSLIEFTLVDAFTTRH